MIPHRISLSNIYDLRPKKCNKLKHKLIKMENHSFVKNCLKMVKMANRGLNQSNFRVGMIYRKVFDIERLGYI